MNTTFHIPHTTTVPCQTFPQVYFHPDLDIDTGSPGWLHATAEDKATRITAQENAERDAVNLCLTCPLLTPCQDWARTTTAHIFGVVGGLVPHERTHTSENIYVLDHERDHRGRVRTDVVARLLRLGTSHHDIAEHLHCSPRTIARIAAGLRKDTTMNTTSTPATPASPARAAITAETNPNRPRQHKKADRPIDPAQLSPQTQHIYEYLSHGQWASREELLTELRDIVTSDQADAFAPKNRAYPTNDAKRDAGARRFLLNRLDIAKRRGRMETRKLDSGEVLIRLSESVAMAWGHAVAS